MHQFREFIVSMARFEDIYVFHNVFMFGIWHGQFYRSHLAELNFLVWETSLLQSKILLVSKILLLVSSPFTNQLFRPRYRNRKKNNWSCPSYFNVLLPFCLLELKRFLCGGTQWHSREYIFCPVLQMLCCVLIRSCSWILNGVLCVLNFEFEECMGNWRWEKNSNKHVPTTVLSLKQETETQNSNAKQKHHNTKHERTKPKI